MAEKKKYNILFFHPSGMFYGGTEKLIQIMAKYAEREFRVFFAYAPQLGEQQKFYFAGTSVTLVPFSFSSRQRSEPYGIAGMQPDIFEIIRANHIDCICTPVSAHAQFPLSVVPAGMPFILTSPFGHYASNGNVHMVFVSGQSNLERLRRRGVVNSRLIMDPIEDFEPRVIQKPPVGETVVFGRIGRADDNIYDPISIEAFARLEKKYGTRVRYDIVNPPPRMSSRVAELGLRQVRFITDLTASMLGNFYLETDVLAHARYDGETFGKAIAEAMMAGLPIITHKSHFHNEHLRLLDDSYARWCEPDDRDGYFENMEWFVQNKQLIRSMGSLARAKAKSMFDPEVQFPAILKEFAAACEKNYFYSFSGTVTGYLRLWLQNLRMAPYVWAKKILLHIPRLQQPVLSWYKKRPLF